MRWYGRYRYWRVGTLVNCLPNLARDSHLVLVKNHHFADFACTAGRSSHVRPARTPALHDRKPWDEAGSSHRPICVIGSCMSAYQWLKIPNKRRALPLPRLYHEVSRAYERFTAVMTTIAIEGSTGVVLTAMICVEGFNTSPMSRGKRWESFLVCSSLSTSSIIRLQDVAM
jgi:hypothetical protein